MPLTRLSLEERIRCVRFYSMYDKASNIQKAWKKEFGTDPPSRKTIAALNKKFDETGSVADLSRSGRPKTSRTDATIALVQEALARDPTKSIRNLSSELGVNKAAVHRIKQESEKKKSTIRLENKKLKEKVVELQRRIAILENRLDPDEVRSGVEAIALNLNNDQKSQILENVDPGHITTIICTSGGAPTGFIDENEPLTTYTVQVVTPAELSQLKDLSHHQLQQLQQQSSRLNQEHLGQVQLAVPDGNQQISNSSGQLACAAFPTLFQISPE